MPLYSYRCPACKEEFEKQLKMAEMEVPEGEPCPACGAGGVFSFISMGQKVAFMDPVRAGFQKPSTDWCNYLNVLKKKNPGAPDFNTFR
jgi:putative FmdB family regulatory protein